MLALRDPIHGFIRADPLEAALVDSRPVQRLRHIHQLGLTFMVFPGAEHSRFSHALGTMELAGRVYDALSARSEESAATRGLLPPGPDSLPRRLVRAAALIHDVGHAPFSHSAEELFEGGIDHEEMSRRLLAHPEMAGPFEEHGRGVTAERVGAVLAGTGEGVDALLSQIVSGELDVDKMDYLLRDSLYCGVRYGSYDLDRLLDTILPIEVPETGRLVLGVEEGGVHALEALVLARYYMFTQVYFNVINKSLELHLSRWLGEEGWRWSADPDAFLEVDDVTVTAALRRSPNPHARALAGRDRFPLAFETGEHLSEAARERFEALLPEARERFGTENLLESHSSKDPHRLGAGPLLVEHADGRLVPMERASQFLRHLARIDRYRVYARREVVDEVAALFGERWREE